MVADALSRRPPGQVQCSPTALICDDSRFLSKLRSSYSLDTHAAAVLAKLNNGRRVKHYSVDGGLLWYQTKRGFRRLYVPASLRTEVLRKMHDHILAGHGGVNTTVERVARSFWWPRMRPSAEEYALTCPDCQQQKPRNTLKPGFLQSLPIPERIWTDISMDFIVGLPPARGCDCIYVVVDRLSKYAHFIPCSSNISAEGVAQLFINHVWKLHGFPKSIITDRDPKFVSAFWRELMQQLSIDHNMTTANHPEADGQTERTNRTLTQYLRLYTHEHPAKWLDFLPCAEWVYNTTVHSSIRCSPASLVYTDAPLSDPSLELAVGSQPRATAASDFRTQLAAARECMRKAQERQARNYDKRRSAVIFNPGDLVLVDSHALRSSREGEQPRKFAARWVGPSTVRSRVNALAYIIDLPPTWRCHRTINVGFLKRFRESSVYTRTLPARQQQPQYTSPQSDDIEVLEVRETTRRGHTRRDYYVKWQGNHTPEWVSEERLREAISEEQLKTLIDSTGPAHPACMRDSA